MKLFRWSKLIILLAVLLGACTQNTDGGGGFTLFPSKTPLPTAVVHVTPAPDAITTVNAYLDALKNNDYAGMYNLLTQVSREAITQEDFTKRYNDALNTMSAANFDYQILAEQKSPYTAEVAYSITYHTALVDDIQREMVTRMALED